MAHQQIPLPNAVLTRDIDLNNEEWTPIGVVKSKYAGTFDGRNHRVTGLYISETVPAGFFAFADTGSLICNLTVSGNITISNLNNSSKTYTIGGLVANARGDILNCCNEVNITLTNFVCTRINVGGICGSIGVNNAVNKIVGCTNSGNIYCSANLGKGTNPVYAGGIAGILNFHPQIDSCKNTGSVIVHLNGFGKGCAGGITNVTYVDQPSINNCYSTGSVNVTKEENLGGLTLSSGAIIGYSQIGPTTATIYYPTHCHYLSGSTTAGMSDVNGQAIADATSGISAKTADELKSADFLASLNAAAPITDYTVTWIAGTDGYPKIDDIQVAAGIKSFTVAGVAATIDQKAHTITAELPAGTDLTTLAPTIVCFAGATSTPASGVAQNFTIPVTYSAGGVSYKVTLTAAEPDFQGEGTQENPYQINSAELLLKLSTEYNKDSAKFSGKYWKQMNDIDMAGVKFTPIGATTAFSGTYDGGNFAIKNLSISSSAANVGLFGIIGNNATIKNVVLESTCTINASAHGGNVGGIVG